MKQKKQKVNVEKKKRIADEILLQIGGSVIAVFLLIAIVSIFMVGWLSITSKRTELTQESNAAANQLTGFLEQYTINAKQLAVNPEIKHVMKEIKAGDDISKAEKMDDVMENLVQIAGTDKENVMAVWISDLDASALKQSDGFTSNEDWDITGRGWYSCIETKEPILTEPYVDSSTGKMILSAAAPVMDEATGEVLGAVGMDIALDHMTEIMSEYKIGRKGFMMLMSENGVVLYHPQTDLIQRNINEVDISQNVMDAVASRSNEFLSYRGNGSKKYGFLQHAGETGYMVLSSMPMSEYFEMLIIMVIALFIVFAVGILLIAVRIKQCAKNLTQPILELNQTAQKLAAGDLDVKLQIQSENEIGELGESIQKTVDRLKEYIVYIDETAEVLEKVSSGKLSIELKNDYVGEFQKIKTALLDISSSMNQVMVGINDSSEQVSVGANELAAASQILAEGAEEQASSIEQITATTTTVAQQVEDSRTEAEASAKATAQAAQIIEQNQENMKQMMAAMDEIHQTSQKVVGIIQTIEDIASQTNLLSLNASIEAARAGEAGKGFAVVADEIRELSTQTKEASNNITTIIHELNGDAKSANESIEASAASVRTQNKMIENMRSRFDNIYEEMTELAAKVKNTEESVNVILTSTDTISENITQLSATSEEVAASSTEGLRTSETSVENMNCCKETLEKISSLAATLKNN